MELIEILKKIGFSEDEAKIYLSCLEIWASQVSNIARHSKIKRTTLYSILDKMNVKWYLGKSVKENIIYFEAIDANIIYKNFQENLLELQINMQEFEKIKNKKNKKYKVTFFEWVENVAKMYKIEVEDNPDLVEIFSSNYDRKKWELDKLRKLRNEIYWKLEIDSKKKIIFNRELTKSEKSRPELSWKVIPKEVLDLPITMKIYNNKVQFISMKSPISWILIEDEEVAKTMSNIFNYIFNN
jgi:HTH-type transcriptional regulator, sugar sensing transcriptional regulator